MGKARDAAKHPAVHRQPQQQRITWPPVLMLPRRREGRQHWGGGAESAMVKVTVRSRNREAKCSLLLVTMETPAQISTERQFFIWKFGSICKLISNFGQAHAERHSPGLLLESKLASVSSTLKRWILSDLDIPFQGYFFRKEIRQHTESQCLHQYYSKK